MADPQDSPRFTLCELVLADNLMFPDTFQRLYASAIGLPSQSPEVLMALHDFKKHGSLLRYMQTQCIRAYPEQQRRFEHLVKCVLSGSNEEDNDG